MNAIDKDTVIRTIMEVLPELKRRYKVASLSLFGSLARGEIGPDSDIDVLVDFERGADLLDLTGLGDYLEELLHHKVDVVSKNGLREELREAVGKEAITI